MAEPDRRHAEKACRRAEEMFLAGNIRGAHRQACTAKRLCPSLAANALDAYEVHVAAAAARPANWRAVLGIAPGAAATQDDVNKQFRRLSVLVHPDRNHSAAAVGAFNLLVQAYDVLSGRSNEPHQPWWREQAERHRPADARLAGQARWKEPPCPYKVIYCKFCKDEFARPCDILQEQAGMMCEDCHRWLRPPWPKKPEPPSKKAAPPPPKAPVFPCPALCPECGALYGSKVSIGKWCLRCKACGKSAMVNVQGPDQATASKSGRA